MTVWLAAAALLALLLVRDASAADADEPQTNALLPGGLDDLIPGIVTDLICVVSNNIINICPQHTHCNYDTGRCMCNTGWTGPKCDISACVPDSSVGCSGHGICQTNKKCICDQGWSGDDCSIFSCVPALTPCVHGTCAAGDDKCTCPAGWKGTLCDEYDCVNAGATPCGDHGTCNTTTSLCVCATGFFGTFCNETVRPPTDCGSFGAYDNVTSSCICKLGWGGDHCENFNCNSMDAACRDHGTCEADGTCTCNPGWSGESCFYFDCTAAGATCGDHQVCNTTTKVCDCEAGWGGVECVTYDCVAAGDVCPAHATCNAQTKACECEAGWSETTPGVNPGLTCDTFSCSASGFSCGAHAECNAATNLCECEAGWSEPTPSPAQGALACTAFNCSTVSDFSCGTNSHCNTELGVCECDAGWSNVATVGGDDSPREVDQIDCETFDCNTAGYDCANHSTCNATTKECVCDDGWEPPACSTFNCTLMTEPLDEFHVCDAATGQIVCAPGREGDDCKTLNCGAVAGYDCGENAACAATGKCECEAGWSEANATNAEDSEAASRACTVENCTTATQPCADGKECNATTAKCECPAGTKENETSGACEPLTCAEDPSLCTDQGYCKEGACHCLDAQYYWDAQNVSCVLGCPGIVFGTCTGANTSECSEGWEGEKCDVFNCNLIENITLPANTSCDPITGQFVCDPGFTMVSGKCTASNCTANPQICGADASCVEGACKCTDAHKYFENDTLSCVLGCPNITAENGACTGPNEAECLPGYEPATAADNETVLCGVYNCTNNPGAQPCGEGECLAPSGNCACFADSFLDPETRKCVLGCPGMTGAHGFCTGVNETHCDDGWSNANGGYCNLYDCTTLPAGTPAEEVCGGLGTCGDQGCECNATATPSQGTCVDVCPATIPGDVLGLDCNDVYVHNA